MRKLLSLLFLFYTVIVTGQDTSAIRWIVEPEQTADKEYSLHVKARIGKNWWIYANNESINVTAPFLTLESGTAVLTDHFQQLSKATTILDPVFSKLIKGFQREAEFIQKIRLSGDVFPIVMRIESFCSDGKNFVPLSQEIKLEFSRNLTGGAASISEKYFKHY